MGEFWIKGPQALALVQKITTNDASKLKPGKVQYTCMPNGKGGIIDDILLYMYDDEKFLMVPNASNIQKDWDWIVSQNDIGAELENSSDNIAQLAIQGPKSIEALQSLTDINLTDLKYYTFVTGKFAGCDEVIISATGYTGSGGFELYMYNQDALKIWTAIMESAKEYDIKPIGLGARDTLRLEMGFCLYGNDIDDTTSPIEANLGWIVKFTDDKKFIDKELLLRQKKEGTGRLLKGFEMIDKGIPRHGYEIADIHGNKIGIVTSGTMSPMLKNGIGMGYINQGFNNNGTEVFIKIRNKLLKAVVVTPPFYKK
jgi:aminomethyltransferase